MKEHLIGILLMLCLLLAGCVDPGVEENPSQDEDDDELLPPDTQPPPGIEQPPADDGNETGGTKVMTHLMKMVIAMRIPTKPTRKSLLKIQTATVMAFLTKKTSVQERTTPLMMTPQANRIVRESNPSGTTMTFC